MHKALNSAIVLVDGDDLNQVCSEISRLHKSITIKVSCRGKALKLIKKLHPDRNILLG